MRLLAPTPSAVLVTALLALTSLAAETPPRAAHPVFTDGQAQIVPEFQESADWIQQKLWVETEFDSDADGRRDRMFVDVTRQRQTETEGLKVPVIYESSPYYAGTSGNRQFLWDVKQELGVQPPPRTSQPATAVQGGSDQRIDLAGGHLGAARLRRRPFGRARARDCRRAASPSDRIRSSWRRRRSSTGSMAAPRVSARSTATTR